MLPVIEREPIQYYLELFFVQCKDDPDWCYSSYVLDVAWCEAFK